MIMKYTVTNGKYKIDNAIDNKMANAINQMVR
ncbi:hypothetical protein MSWAN_0942 [Methanobacterium paludis]|jgi:hypothetical protein|uniref:Uncharacterized protein n=1 Tax=Methanobacterium paludis (strain DSM 25820 / JCM 18151 / SWAN1) TaxID=868131 RepID=F6D2N2_METPW|nr:hypothetical protein MSWAN_0942 [Methanobacterium paludis]